MTEQVTTYRVQGKEIGLIFLFKYDLNGFIRGWEVSYGELNEQQSTWLFSVPEGQQAARFPSNQESFIERWLNNPDILAKFDITTRPADISFDALWALYNHKLAKQDAIKAFKKLKEDEIILCFQDVPKYLQWLKYNPKVQQLNLATYINARRYEDERPDNFKGKVFNNALKDLAATKSVK